MDASYKIQRGIHVHLIQFFMCPEFWVHIKKGLRFLYHLSDFRFQPWPETIAITTLLEFCSWLVVTKKEVRQTNVEYGFACLLFLAVCHYLDPDNLQYGENLVRRQP